MRRGTYSIVARDAATGELGVAVQSHWFSVGVGRQLGRGRLGRRGDTVGRGAGVRPAAAGAARRGTSLLAAALDGLLAADEAARFRQVAVVGSDGADRGPHRQGLYPLRGSMSTGEGFSAQANMMAAAGVPEAMAAAYEAAEGSLDEAATGGARGG